MSSQFISVHSIVFLLLTLCFSSRPLIADGNRLTIGVIKDIEEIFPVSQVPGSNQFIRNMIMPPIVAIDDKGNWFCNICKELPNLEKGTRQTLKSPNSKKY